MQVINPNNASHSIVIVPRYYTNTSLDMLIYNESKQEETSVINTHSNLDGYMTVNFDFDSIEGFKYQFKLVEGTEIVYRGILIATAEETQTFLADNNEFNYYE